MIAEVPIEVREKIDELVEADLLTVEDAKLVLSRFHSDRIHWLNLLSEISAEPRRRRPRPDAAAVE